MRVKELLKQLEGRDPDMEVLFIEGFKCSSELYHSLEIIESGKIGVPVFIPDNRVAQLRISEKSLKTPPFFEKLLKKIGL